MAAPMKLVCLYLFSTVCCVMAIDAHKNWWKTNQLMPMFLNESAEYGRNQITDSKSKLLYSRPFISTATKTVRQNQVRNGGLKFRFDAKQFRPNHVTNGDKTVKHNHHHVLSSLPETTQRKQSLQSRQLSIVRKSEIARNNLAINPKRTKAPVFDSTTPIFLPRQKAPPFTLPTLRGALAYPGPVINRTTPIIFHSFNPNSGFLACFWNCSEALGLDFLERSPVNTHFVFISSSTTAYQDIHWMKERLLQVIPPNSTWSTIERLHFATLPLYEIGSWIPRLLWQWSCPDHNCGLDQVVIKSPALSQKLRHPLVLKRLDARYDWLPSPSGVFGDKVLPLDLVNDSSKGCDTSVPMIAKGTIALVPEGGCSYFRKVYNLQKAGASAVLILRTTSTVVQDMNCVRAECDTPLSVPASMIDYSENLQNNLQNATVQFQTTPSENFFFAIDHEGNLAETGWLLYPSFKFLMWQAQWFGYKKNLTDRLAKELDVLVVPVFNQTRMQGADGAVSKVTLPDIHILQQYRTFELDASLTCPEGGLDQDCPHWDHTIQLYVCCERTSPLCGMELGRWISPFRRGIGRWITDVSGLLPLLTAAACTFTMKSVPWAMAWSPSLTLRFSNKYSGTGTDAYVYPSKVWPLYHPQFTFDKNYNHNFPELSFLITASTKKLTLTSVITGHGSDENGCGEFCVTSHHFVFNGHSYNRTFDIAGSPLGCAERVPEGVEPNEHGTWLYGRDGWCDGQQVAPWVIDLTSSVKVPGNNTLTYYGWFNGSDPQPKRNPGIMIFYSYLTAYEQRVGGN